MKKLMIRPMEHYYDRGKGSRCVEIAEDLFRNKIYLSNAYSFEATTENIFDTVFETGDKSYDHYLFAMDYLSFLLSAYEQTGEPRYQEKFLEIVRQFFDFYERGTLVFTKSYDLTVCAQTVMFIKSFGLISYDEILKEKIIDLLYSHALYFYDDRNHADNDNHGLFSDLGLLHVSVLFEALSEARDWQRHAVERVRRLYAAAFYQDGFNNEGSMSYFRLNIYLYQRVLDFCRVYKITGLEPVQKGLDRSKEVLQAFAHSDGSFPAIGDGLEFSDPQFKCDSISAIYRDGGICVMKTGGIYLTFKSKSFLQAHTHVDDTSITIRYRNMDLALDGGQYNYDRYDPINRYLRTSGGHSGVFPLFADGLSLCEYLNRRNHAEIETFEFDGTIGRVSGGYELDAGAIQVRRNIYVVPNRIEIRDQWECASPQVMRQRFILPKELLPKSRFTASKQLFETATGGCRIQYQVQSNGAALTTMNFGVISRAYHEFEPAVLLDTTVENMARGEITTIITIQDEGDLASE